MYPPKAVQDATKPAVVAPAPAPTPVTTFKMPTQVREAITLQGGNPDEFETRMQKAFSSKDPVVVKKAMGAYGAFLDANTDIRQPSYYSLLSPGSDLSFGDQLKLDAWDDFKNNAINSLAQTKKGLRDTGSTIGHVLGLVPDLEKALNTNQEIQKLQTLALSGKGSKDMFDDFSINSFAATMGQGVGQVGASLAPMAIGAFTGPVGLKVGQAAGFVISSAQMYGQLLDDFRAKGIPAETAAMYAGPLAAILGIVETKLPLEQLVDKFASPLLSKSVLDPIISSVAAKGITKETMGELEKSIFSSQKQWLKGKASAVGAAVATQGGIEFAEEFSQGYIEDAGKKLYDWLNSDTRFKDIDFGSYQQFVDKMKDGTIGALIGGHLASGVVLKSLHNQTLYPYLDKGIQNGDLDRRVQNLTNHAEFLVSKGKLDPAKRDLFLQDVQEVATLAQQVRGWAKPTADAQTRFDLFQLNRFRQEYLNHAAELNGQNQQMLQSSVSLNPFEKGKNAKVIADNDQMLRFLNDATAFIDTELSDLGADKKTFDRNEFNLGLQTIYQNYNGGNTATTIQNPANQNQTVDIPTEANLPAGSTGSQPQPRAEGQDVSAQPSLSTATPSATGTDVSGAAGTPQDTNDVSGRGNQPISGGEPQNTRNATNDTLESSGTVSSGLAKPLTPTEKALALAEEKVTKANRLKDAKKTVTAIEKDYPGFFEFAKSKLDGLKKTDHLVKKLAENPDEVNLILDEYKQLQDEEDQRYRKAHNDYVDRAEQYNAFIEANKFKAKNGTYQSAESSQRKWLQANAPTFGLNVQFGTKGVTMTNSDGQKATRFGMPKDPATYIKPEDLTTEEYQNFDQYIRPYFADYYEKFVNKDTQQFQFSFSANGVVKNGSVAEGIRAAVEDIADGKSTKRADGLLMFVRLSTNEGGLPIWVVKTAATQEKGMIPWDTLVQKEAEDFLTDAELEPYTNFVLDFLSAEDWSETDRDGIANALDEYLDMTEGYPIFDYQTYELDRDLGDETVFETLTPQAATSLVTLFDQLTEWQKEVDEYNRRPDVFPPINTFQYATDQRGDQQTVPTAEQNPGETQQGDVSPDNQPENSAESADPNEQSPTNSNGPSTDSNLSGEEPATPTGEPGQNEVSTVQAQIGEAQSVENSQVIALAREIQSVFPNVDLITDPAEIDRIQQENPNEFVPVTSQSGQLLGFNFRGKVYVDPRVATPETAIHEFGHVWADVAEQESPALFERGLSLIRGTEYEQRVREQYPWLAEQNVSKQFDWLTADRKLLKEALVQAIGKKGIALKNQSKLERFGKWISRLFRDLGESFGMEFNPDTRLDDFVTAAAADLLSGKKLSDITSEQLAQSQTDPQALVANTPQTPLAGQRFTPSQIAQDRTDLKAAIQDAKTKISEGNSRKKILGKRIDNLKGKIATYTQIINDPKTNVGQVKTYAKRLAKADAARQAVEAEINDIKQLLKDQKSLQEAAEMLLKSRDKLVTDSMVIYDADGNASYAVVDENSVSREMQAVAQQREIQQANAGILGKLHATIFSGSRLNPFVRTFEPHLIADYLFQKGSTLHNVMGETVKALSKKVGPLRVKGHDIMMDLTNQFRDICTYRGIASPDTMLSKGLIETITNTDGTTVEIPHDYLVTMVATYKTQMEEYGSSSMVEGQGTLLQDWKNPERRIKVKVDAAEMLRLEQVVDNNYADLLAKTQDYFQFVLPSLQETYLNLEAKALPLANASFYFPIRYESELKEAVADGTTALVRDAPFVKERKGINDQDLIVTQSIFEMMNRYMRGTENYVQLMPSSQNFNLVKKHTTPFMERNGLMAYNREIEKMAIKFNNPMSDFEGGSKSIGVTAFKKVMGLTTLSRFALNVALPLKNLTGYSAALGQGIVDDKHIRDQFGFVVSAFGNGYYRLFSGIPKGLANLSDPSQVNNPQSQAIQDTIAEMYANPDAGPILSRVLNDGMPDLNTVEWATISAVSENNGVRTTIRRYNQAIGFIKEQGLTAQQQADSAVMLGFWRAATAHVQEVMASETYDVQQKEIARLANDLMYATNATYDLTDKSSLQLDGRWWSKMIILYQSQGFKVFNTMVKSINEYIMNPDAANRKIMMANVRHTMIYAPIYIAMVNIFASGLRALGDDDKEEKIFEPENMAWEIAGQLSQILPVANVATEFFVSAIDNRPWSSPIAQLDPLEPINKGAQGLLEAISLSVQDFETTADEREADRKIKKGFQDAATELPTALGIPRELIRLVNKYAVTPALEE